MLNPRTVAIVGSRNWKDPHVIYGAVRKLRPGTVVVTGGAPGVDKWAEMEALATGLVVARIIPPWDALGKSAGPIRNKIIAAFADRAIVFWDGQSAGTGNAIQCFKALGKNYEIIKPPTTGKE